MSLAPAASQPPLRRWSTDAVDPQQRLDYWVGAICEAFLEMDCDARERGAFQGSLTQVDGGELAYNQVRAAPQDVYRTPAAISRGGSPAFYLITHLHAPWHVRQGGHTQQLRQGDAVLIDAARPYELHFPQPTECLSIALPRACASFACSARPSCCSSRAWRWCRWPTSAAAAASATHRTSFASSSRPTASRRPAGAACTSADFAGTWRPLRCHAAAIRAMRA